MRRRGGRGACLGQGCDHSMGCLDTPRRSCWMQCQTDQTSAECPDLTQEAGPLSLAWGDAWAMQHRRGHGPLSDPSPCQMTVTQLGHVTTLKSAVSSQICHGGSRGAGSSQPQKGKHRSAAMGSPVAGSHCALGTRGTAGLAASGSPMPPAAAAPHPRRVCLALKAPQSPHSSPAAARP